MSDEPVVRWRHEETWQDAAGDDVVGRVLDPDGKTYTLVVEVLSTASVVVRASSPERALEWAQDEAAKSGFLVDDVPDYDWPTVKITEHTPPIDPMSKFGPELPAGFIYARAAGGHMHHVLHGDSQTALCGHRPSGRPGKIRARHGWHRSDGKPHPIPCRKCLAKRGAIASRPAQS